MTDEEINLSLMPLDMYADVEDFHKKYEQFYDGLPRMLPRGLSEFRISFLKEEYMEYAMASSRLKKAVEAKDDSEITYQLEEQLDALVDLTYVIFGTSILHGFDFKVAWMRVHAKNMEKIKAETAENSKRGWAGDVVKPEGWTPPRHADLVEDHAHRQEELPL